MATVPRLSGPSVDPTVVRGGEMTAHDFGSDAIGRGLQNVAGVVGQIAAKEQEKADTTALMAFENALAETENTLLYDPEQGAYSKQGVNAIEAPQTLWPEWDRRAGEAMDRLPAHLRPAAMRTAEARRNDANRGVMRHVMRESDAYHQAQSETMVAQAVDAARLNYLDPERVETEASRAMLAAGASADRVGADAVTRGRLLQQARSGVLQAAVERRLIDDPVAARDYYETVRPYLTGAAQAELEQKFRPLIEDTQAAADASWAQRGGVVGDITIPPQRGEPPAAVASAIQAAAQKHGVPVEFLYALAEQESGFRPGVRGEILEDGDRAEGLFQYRKTTADEQGLTNRSDPAASADVAARQFRQRMDEHGVEFAIAAHFAGEGGAAAVLKRGRSAQNPKTAEYLRQVMGRAERWRGGGQPGQQVAQGPVESEADAIERLRSIPDPRRREAAMKRVRDDFTMRRAREAEDAKVRSERVIGAINADPTVPLARALSAEDYAALEADGKLPSMENYRTQMLEGRMIKSDPLLVEEIDREMVLDPTAFAKRDVRAYADRLEAGDLARYTKAQTEINKPEKRAQTLTNEQRIERALTGLGLSKIDDASGGSQKRNATRDQQRGEYRLLYTRAVETYIQLNGKAPTPEAADAIMRHTQRTFAENMAKGTTGIYSDAQQFRSSITETDRRRLRDAWAAKYGRQPTDAELTIYFARRAKGAATAGGSK